MAYALRLTIEGSDTNENNVEIKVYQEGFSGEAVTRSGARNVLEIDWGSKSGELLPLIYGSEATVRFFSESDYEFLDLFTTNARDLFVEIIVNDTESKFLGFIEPEKWSEPLISPNYEVQFTAFDGLGFLKDEDFLDDDKEYLTGEKTLLEILQLILAKTGLELPLNTRVNYRPSGQSDTADALTQTKKDLKTYRGKSCYEVLEALFLNTRIFQRNGEWHIISNDEWKRSGSTITWYAYTSAGADDGTKQTTKEFTSFWFEDQATLEMMPPLKQLRVIQDYGYKPNLVDNSNFDNFENGNFDGWTAVNVEPKQYIYDSDGNKFVYLPGAEQADPWDEADRTKYLVSDSIPVNASSDIFNFSLSFALMGPKGTSAYVFFGMLLEGDDGKDYALEIYRTTTAPREIKYRWKEHTHKLAVPVKSSIKKTNPFPWLNPSYSIEPDRIEAYPHSEIVNHFKSASFSIEGGVPTSGTVKMYLFLQHSGSSLKGSCFRNIKLLLTDEEEEDFPTKTEYILINSLRNNYTPANIEMINGDLPDIPNKQTIYNGGFILADGTDTATLTWALDDDSGVYTYAELMARMLASQLRIPKQSYQVRLGSTAPTLAMIFQDDDNPGKTFIEAGCKYIFHLNTTEGRYIELLNTTLPPYTIAERVSTDDSTPGQPSASTGTSSGTTFAADEKVKLIDPDDYELFGQAGYLSSNEFEQTVDPDSGRAVIKIREHKAQIVDLEAEELSDPGFLSSDDFETEEDTETGIVIVKPKLFPRAGKENLTAGNNTITFSSAFPTGTDYILHTYTYDDNNYQVGSYIIEETDGSDGDETGFTIYAAKSCKLRYTATPVR
jgi:hypothetical protein